jgi:hypothetical protein
MFTSGRQRSHRNADYRLARFVLDDLIRNSERLGTRAKAEAFIRKRLPLHDIAKRTEWLNGVATTLKTYFQLPDEALHLFQKTIATTPVLPNPITESTTFTGKSKVTMRLSIGCVRPSPFSQITGGQPTRWVACSPIKRNIGKQSFTIKKPWS